MRIETYDLPYIKRNSYMASEANILGYDTGIVSHCHLVAQWLNVRNAVWKSWVRFPSDVELIFLEASVRSKRIISVIILTGFILTKTKMFFLCNYSFFYFYAW